MTDAPSAGGRPYLYVKIVDVADGEGRWQFYERHSEQRLSMARAGNYAEYEWVDSGGRGNYLYAEYIWQPAAGDCRYRVVEHGHPSWINPNGYAFVVATGICEEELARYETQRQFILVSFRELAP